MSLFVAVLQSDFKNVKRIIDSMAKNPEELSIAINMTIGYNPPMTLYDAAVEQHREEGSVAARNIVDYMRANGALTYAELAATQPPDRISPDVPLSVRGIPLFSVKNIGIASLPRRRKVVSLARRGGVNTRKTRKTRKNRRS